MAKISANNIQTGTITSDKLDAAVVSGLANANNANAVAAIASTTAAAAFSSANTISSILANSAPIITTIQIADSSYTVLDDTAANTTGGYVVITGSGFVSTPTVIFGTTSATAVTYVSSTTLRVQVPALNAASYPVYVINTNGGTAIKINGLTTSSFPAWSTGSTLSGQVANVAFSVSLSASSDSGITYSNTTSLPAGTTLAANGLFSGTVTIGSQTTYSFDVRANDAENQDASRTFSLTVTVPMASGLYFIGGYNYRGVAGLNNEINRSSPVQVGTNTNWNSISRNTGSAIATKTDGTLWLWGDNRYGQLGLNDLAVYRSSPTQVGSNTTWAQGADKISAGAFNNGAIKTDGTLWLWGRGNYGVNANNQQFPNGSRSSPSQVGAGTDWNKLFLAGGNNGHAFAIKTNGTLWAWGQSNSGTLGLSDQVSKSSPTQVGAGTNWNLVSASSYVAAIKTDGTLWTWGAGQAGVLGRNNSVYTSSPTQVGATTNWSKVDVGGFSMGAIKTDGTLWTWGQNNQGQLGLSDVVLRSSPVQVGVATNWSQLTISPSGPGFYATKTDGTLWAWGNNGSGQLGFNDRANRSSPVQIGTGTSWSLISAGLQSIHAIIT